MAKTAFITGVIAVLLLLLLLLSASPSTKEIKTLTITSDTRPMILLEKYGFTHTGHVFISVSSVPVVAPPSSSSQPDPSRLGFFLLSEESLLQVLIENQQNPNFCVLDSHYIIKLFTFRNLSPPPSASANRTYAVKIPNECSLFFANCAPETAVSMSLRIELYNLDDSTTRDYLSAGVTFLRTLFYTIFFSFGSLGVYISSYFLTRFVIRAVFFREKQWVNNLVQETITLLFCIITFRVFGLAEKDEFSQNAEEEQVLQIVFTQ